MHIYTIGFSKRNAEEFFEALKENKIKTLIDIRLNNKSQLAGFTKRSDIEYLLKQIAGIKYAYFPEFAPTKEILDKYRDSKITWDEYENKYNQLLKERKPLFNVNKEIFQDSCLLCSEFLPDKCHRRLAAEYIKNYYDDITIIHL
ncbi:MAG: DUF488 domain-containing protein [Bacillota bacterium]|nr:DUF488 domain-containing protein [Bacillota bacterium]